MHEMDAYGVSLPYRKWLEEPLHEYEVLMQFDIGSPYNMYSRLELSKTDASKVYLHKSRGQLSPVWNRNIQNVKCEACMWKLYSSMHCTSSVLFIRWTISVAHNM
jgi:uncharacterized protein YkwD